MKNVFVSFYPCHVIKKPLGHHNRIMNKSIDETMLRGMHTFYRFLSISAKEKTISDLSVSSSSWGLGRAAVCDRGTPWTFLLPVFSFLAIQRRFLCCSFSLFVSGGFMLTVFVSFLFGTSGRLCVLIVAFSW